jgi:putative sterol carrier protein
MAVDIQKLFNELVPQGIANHTDKAKEINAKFQINITGDGGGEWFIDLTPDGLKSFAGNPGGADVVITMATEDFQKLQENPQANGMQLFFAGKLKVSGNQMLAMKLPKLFEVVGK